MTFTGERKPPPFNKVSHLPYDLLPMEKYLGTNADFGYQSSRGCPHRCAFCAEVALYPKTWRPKPAHVIVTEIEEIIKRFRPERIFFVDSNFFCSKKRVREFCNLVLERSINTKFFGECRFDYFYRYEHEFIDLIKRAGFNEIEFGGESGSDITLADIKKDITSKQILSGIQKCKDTGLKSFTSFMIGFPGESEKERQKTLGIYDQILAIDPNGARINGMFIYSPFPGTELYDRVVKQWGFRPPQSLAEWSKFELYDSSNITWFDAEKKREFQTISTIVRYFFVFKTIMQWSSSQKVKRHSGFFKALLSLVFNGLLYPLAKVRWRFRVFDFGYEWQLWQKAFYSYMGRK